MVLSACGSSGEATGGATDDGGNAGISDTSSMSVAWNEQLDETNPDSSTGNATKNANVLYLTNDRFMYYDDQLNLVQDPGFGSYEKVSDDPLQVKYTFADTATWSDGTPVDAADLVMFWGAVSGNFNTIADEDALTDEGETDEKATADQVYFNGTNSTVGLIEDFPEISDDGKSITFTYTKPFGDWNVNLETGVPAHVVAQHALGVEDPAEAKQALIDAFKNEDKDALVKISKFWNTGFQFSGALPDDPSLYLSSGPYIMTEYKQDQYLTLEARDDYEGDRTGGPEKITIRTIPDAMAAVSALQNGEVDLISPQSTTDVVEALKALGDDYTVLEGIEGTYEHVDLMFDNGGPFDPATYGGDAAAALKVRQAFLKLIPRQEILDKLIVPLNSQAVIRNSYNVLPGAPMYDAVTEANQMGAKFSEVDVDGAKQLLEEAGVDTPVDVRFLFDKANPRRQNEYTLIAQSAGQDDLFNVIDSSSDEWGRLLSDNSKYDASVFGWQSTSTAVTEGDANYRTGAINNFGGYSSETVDGLLDQLLVATEPAEQEELLGKIEAQLVDDAFGLTLYQFPSVTAYRSTIEGIDPITISPTIFYGFWNWKVGS
ncbi:ABC transporter family substrate-binding protein [Pseudactinotalea sp. HY160]|nr:ABC transporter family substrate-binding protein [Pseudactinotalea sp. HY160]QGH70928.1 ABC transporter family substrate-binding protein [Pseudactinotalea sp. HY158]